MQALQAPFPWFGGKAAIASEVWKRFGNVPNYVEPFFGSGAVLLGRPGKKFGIETVNDIDGLVCNFWRAVKAVPDAVADYADWPTSENDLHARHAWLVSQKNSLQKRLEGDPEYFDAKIAGWWVWGLSLWIAAGFCFQDGPWRVMDRKLIRDRGCKGIRRKIICLGGRMGIHKVLNKRELSIWMQALAERFSRVRVCCGDWKRICGGSKDSFGCFFMGGNSCGIFLDPPYTERYSNLYRTDSQIVANSVWEWAIKHGDNRQLRIALCGYENDHDMPGNWDCFEWKAAGGYENQVKRKKERNRGRERVWFSPHCLKGHGGFVLD